MCISTQALALFLSIIGADLVSTSPAVVTVHATEGDAVWTLVGDQWCTRAPQDDAAARFATLRQ